MDARMKGILPGEKGIIELNGEYGRASCTLGICRLFDDPFAAGPWAAKPLG